MGRKKHVVDLSNEERNELKRFVSKGEHRAEAITRAKILLKSDEGLTDPTICEHLNCAISSPYRTRKAYAERGLAAIHRRKPDRDYEPKLDGRAEAHLVALACSEPPEGRSRWTYALLADRLVSLEEIEFDSISEEAVRRRLKKRPEATPL
ncbi:helix-turn-helix domain-containing protein [Natrarchaeobius oligotrophus]|uniref:helix-turn-helix domain-containing protein n=1 Tax=Natrarchaeobius oligotrophus TaxID=3455743 RepID=UPI001A9D39CA|nr:helix-turn-helix domain-containing protein [Natrarchaeobius chitinivorans]